MKQFLEFETMENTGYDGIFGIPISSIRDIKQSSETGLSYIITQNLDGNKFRQFMITKEEYQKIKSKLNENRLNDNFIPYPENKPKKDGWYLVWIADDFYEGEANIVYPEVLIWQKKEWFLSEEDSYSYKTIAFNPTRIKLPKGIKLPKIENDLPALETLIEELEKNPECKDLIKTLQLIRRKFGRIYT